MSSALLAVQQEALLLCQKLIKQQPDLKAVFCSSMRLLTEEVYGQALHSVPYALPFPPSYLAGRRDDFDALASLRDDLPADWIARAYEYLLQFEYQPDKALLVAKTRSKKRSGSYYTPYDLAELAVKTGLQDLVFDPQANCPRSPQEILNLRVVDPSMGGGTFLIGAVHFLVEAVISSCAYFDMPLYTVLGKYSDAADLASQPDAALRSILTRVVTESCIYGVDIDAGAVSAARLALSFLPGQEQPESTYLKLEQKLKCGNALIGYWSDDTAKTPSVNAHQYDIICARYFLPEASASVVPEPLLVTRLRKQLKFFHWSLEFPDVFNSAQSQGFDAVLGNPPWEIEKANSREFFQAHISDYWSLGKQEALEKRELLCDRDSQVQLLWNLHLNEFRAFANYLARSENFKLQGASDLNAYKLFIELSYRLVKEGGVVSLLVPSGIYTDKGASRLREALLSTCKWKSLQGFRNNRGLFDIHRSFSFCILSFEKGGQTDELSAGFDSDTVDSADSLMPLKISRQVIEKFSPKNLAIPSITSKQDLNLLEKISDGSVSLDEFLRARNFTFSREFDMTNDSNVFSSRDVLEKQGYSCDQFGHWLKGGWSSNNGSASDDSVTSADGKSRISLSAIESIAYPLYEGRMIAQFNSSAKGWVEGKGRQAVWKRSAEGAALKPQYLVLAGHVPNDVQKLKVGYLAVGSSTNSRTMIAACIAGLPCGNSVPTFSSGSEHDALLLTCLLNSFVFDYVLRLKMSGNNLNYFLLQECLVPKVIDYEREIVEIAAALNFTMSMFSPYIIELGITDWEWLRDQERRLHLRAVLDALIAKMYGLDYHDLACILRDCSLACSEVSAQSRRGEKLDSKGFWRLDKELPVAERHTVRTLALFEELEQTGVEPFMQTYRLTRSADGADKLVANANLILRLRQLQNS